MRGPSTPARLFIGHPGPVHGVDRHHRARQRDRGAFDECDRPLEAGDPLAEPGPRGPERIEQPAPQFEAPRRIDVIKAIEGLADVVGISVKSVAGSAPPSD